ncbi:MAG: hypothetical protein IT290_00350 [Deltaproteobacteria bacterium]|nr:hypothetical protein [Deltaproteobacteria bacterium]
MGLIQRLPESWVLRWNRLDVMQVLSMTTMQAKVRRTFKEGPITIMLIVFDGEPRVGVRFFRWQPKRLAPGGSTETFHPRHIEALTNACERVLEEIALIETEGGGEKNAIRDWTTRQRNVEPPLHEEIFGEVLLTIHEGKKGPWFMLRRVVGDEPGATANWFFAEHLPQIDEALIEMRRWLQALPAKAS